MNYVASLSATRGKTTPTTRVVLLSFGPQVVPGVEARAKEIKRMRSVHVEKIGESRDQFREF
ncbi:conserved hypothetical protein [Ricinus communis]|uniref:Uncharacterized protein n=1 Tax=Ricinus communis TaxID=3988 RepID=B9RNZ5_RICCO|nr:conserved hypothetical protein [Ricinus communis]